MIAGIIRMNKYRINEKRTSETDASAEKPGRFFRNIGIKKRESNKVLN